MINCIYVSFFFLLIRTETCHNHRFDKNCNLSRLIIIRIIKFMHFRYLNISLIIPITRFLLLFFNEMLINNLFSRSKQKLLSVL